MFFLNYFKSLSLVICPEKQIVHFSTFNTFFLAEKLNIGSTSWISILDFLSLPSCGQKRILDTDKQATPTSSRTSIHTPQMNTLAASLSFVNISLSLEKKLIQLTTAHAQLLPSQWFCICISLPAIGAKPFFIKMDYESQQQSQNWNQIQFSMKIIGYLWKQNKHLIKDNGDTFPHSYVGLRLGSGKLVGLWWLWGHGGTWTTQVQLRWRGGERWGEWDKGEKERGQKLRKTKDDRKQQGARRREMEAGWWQEGKDSKRRRDITRGRGTDGKAEWEREVGWSEHSPMCSPDSYFLPQHWGLIESRILRHTVA